MSGTPKRIDLHAMATETANTWDRAQLRKAGRYQAHLEGENLRLASELETVKAERDGLNRDQTQLAARVDELKAQLANRATVPRVITADELRPWMTVARHWEGPNGPRWEATMTTPWNIGAFEDDLTIVLLEDAPAEEPVKVGDKISTEEQVKLLPRQTILRGCEGDALEQGLGGWWWMAGASDRLYASSMVTKHAPFTVLYLPEEDA